MEKLIFKVHIKGIEIIVFFLLLSVALEHRKGRIAASGKRTAQSMSSQKQMGAGNARRKTLKRKYEVGSPVLCPDISV